MIYSALLLSGLSAVVASNWQQHGYNFETYLGDFNVKHSWDSDEFAMRKGIFEQELARVKLHNSENHTWKETINRFSYMTRAEKQAMNGYSKGAAQSHKPQYEVPADFEIKPLSQLPSSVDWRDTPNVVSAVKDQGHCGSCWAFSATETLESHVAISTGLLYNFSPQQIAMCSPNPDSCGGTGGCEGATTELGFDYVASSGILEEYQLGYSAYSGQDSPCGFSTETVPVATITGYTKLEENNYLALMNAVAQKGPVAVVVDASEWHSYDSGIFNGCNQKSPDLNHGVVLVGYGEENGQKYWLVRNSWSPSYGEQGYIRIARADMENELCGLDITPQDGTACAGDNTPVKVCGTCGILYDSSYPTGAALA
mmetsp:Transcript_8987/g.13508  ORF Transcript_8987/g.13508 Transcript_8987/m.13508 type:complete len:369 (-) Transcript_8987:140-1246(-)|eukprot:CAMPEP_0185017466 /NCGR_PEP_ID=MMETSP1103-20130426/417_1 /TAXON_ID=36769 /ORGANISM="Paraphysomonas bandaiensis, Strain Caron Lab Isolate" /LENGTH=368 /DNA_ID=CAMNT_0027546891 /DNA_START=42 /DNA_END=1148 /DNA_ORIENTATION=-